jgi:hypothetical protein
MAKEKAQWEVWAALTHHTVYKINFYLEKLSFANSAPPKKAHKSTFSSMQLNQSIFWNPVTFICKQKVKKISFL